MQNNKLGYLIILLVMLFSCKEEEIDLCENAHCLNKSICNLGVCECLEGFEGTRCEKQILPSKMYLKKVKVLHFNEFDSSDNLWDPTNSGDDVYPDIYLRLHKIGDTADSLVWLSTLYRYHFNADHTQEYDFDLDTLVAFDNPKDRYVLRLYDWDGFYPFGDWMGGVSFTPYWDNTNDFPNEINLNPPDGTVSLRIEVEYEFE